MLRPFLRNAMILLDEGGLPALTSVHLRQGGFGLNRLTLERRCRLLHAREQAAADAKVPSFWSITKVIPAPSWLVPETQA